MTKGQDTRATILEHALALSSRFGLEGLTIGTLASEVGMTKSGVYAHFDSKEALQVAVLDTARDRFVELVVAPGLRAPRGEPRVRELFERWVAWGERTVLPGGCPFVAAASEFDDRPGSVRDTLVAHQRDWVGMLASTAADAVAEGHFRADLDPRTWAQELFGVVLAYYHFAHLLCMPDAGARARQAFERLMTDASGVLAT